MNEAHRTWKEEDAGQMGAIEKHIAIRAAHGHCCSPTKEELNRKVQELVQKAVEESEISE